MNEEYNTDLLRAWTLESSLHFTRYFFKETNGMKFIIGKHHQLICNALDDVLNGKCKKLIINIFPRSGKTEVAVKNFIAMGLAVNPKANFIHLSYSANLAADNSVSVKSIIQSEAYQRLYPTRISYGKNQQSQWETDQGGGVYATSTLGQITGFGAGLVEEEGSEYRFGGAIIIDDPIKPEDALSDVVRERVNRRFETTIRNRVNSRNTPIIIIMQRLHEHDLCGYLQEIEPDDWRVLSLPAIQYDKNGNRESLWEYKFTVEELDKINAANSFVFETQYMQNPTPMEGLMYPLPFKTYEILPPLKTGTLCNYTDTADTGSDYLCSIDYLATKEGYFVIDVLFTKKPMEYTEQATAQMISKDNIRYAFIESNNGGRTFGRNVERYCRLYDNRKTSFLPFTQTKNKQVRIFSHSAEVNNMIIFPADWERRWPEFAASVKGYRKEGRNANDDSCFVAGTKVATIFGDKAIERIKAGEYVLTPFGVKRVLESGKTGHKPVVSRFGLQLTENHKIFNSDGFKPVLECDEDLLSMYGLKNQIIWRLKKLFISTESNTGLWGRDGIILASQRVMKGEKVLKAYTSLFGSFIIRWKFLKAIVFITKTIILLTTTLTTWSVYRLGNICRIMKKKSGKTKNTGKKLLTVWIRCVSRLLNGIKAQKVELGTARMQKGKDQKTSSSSAGFAGKNSIPLSPTPCSAVTGAEKITGESSNSNTSESVQNAGKSSGTGKVRQVEKTGNSAHAHVLPQTETITVKDVYNITVEDVGCFYANGVLVSNCDVLTGIVEKGNLVGGATDEELMRDFL